MEYIPLERAITDKIMRYLKSLSPHGWFFKTHGGSMQIAGLPDIIGLYHGRFVALEVKRPKLGRLTKLQEKILGLICAAGGIAGVVTSVEEVQQIIGGGFHVDG